MKKTEMELGDLKDILNQLFVIKEDFTETIKTISKIEEKITKKIKVFEGDSIASKFNTELDSLPSKIKNRINELTDYFKDKLNPNNYIVTGYLRTKYLEDVKKHITVFNDDEIIFVKMPVFFFNPKTKEMTLNPPYFEETNSMGDYVFCQMDEIILDNSLETVMNEIKQTVKCLIIKIRHDESIFLEKTENNFTTVSFFTVKTI
jgi:hypothetical protein